MCISTSKDLPALISDEPTTYLGNSSSSDKIRHMLSRTMSSLFWNSYHPKMNDESTQLVFGLWNFFVSYIFSISCGLEWYYIHKECDFTADPQIFLWQHQLALHMLNLWAFVQDPSSQMRNKPLQLQVAQT